MYEELYSAFVIMQYLLQYFLNKHFLSFFIFISLVKDICSVLIQQYHIAIVFLYVKLVFVPITIYLMQTPLQII